MLTVQPVRCQVWSKVHFGCDCSHVVGDPSIANHTPTSAKCTSVRVQWTPEEIKARRSGRGLNQQGLADALNVSRRAVINWETGKAEPRGSNLRALERVLGGHEDDTDDERVLRTVKDWRLWAELQHRYNAAIESARSAQQPPKWPGRPGTYPSDPLLSDVPPEDDDEEESSGG